MKVSRSTGEKKNLGLSPAFINPSRRGMQPSRLREETSEEGGALGENKHIRKSRGNH